MTTAALVVTGLAALVHVHVLVGALSMVGAGLVLVLSDRTEVRPALVQLVPALLGSLLLIAALTTD